LPWDNTLHKNSKKLVSALFTGCTPGQRNLPTEPIKLTCSFMWQSPPLARNCWSNHRTITSTTNMSLKHGENRSVLLEILNILRRME
jgi:hypothetical protein